MMTNTLRVAALAALLPAAALAAAVDKPLTRQDFVPSRPTTRLPASGPDQPLKNGRLVRVRMGDKIVPVLILHNFPLPYPMCWQVAARPEERCIIEDKNSPHPPRP